MPTITQRPAADPLDDIDRDASGADSQMHRQDRADRPGERGDAPSGDVYLDAARAVSEGARDPRQEAIDGDREAERILDGDRDVVLPVDARQGADDDDPIDETERQGDDSIR